MSTYIYLECTAHYPTIRADSESGQHDYDLPRLREEIAHRDEYAAAVNIEAHWPERFTDTTARFFAKHPECPIRIIDEYGNIHPLKAEDETKTSNKMENPETTKLNDALQTFKRASTPGEAPALLEACAKFAQIGWRPEQVEELIDAITESRTVAFGFGKTHIIGTTDRSKL